VVARAGPIPTAAAPQIPTEPPATEIPDRASRSVGARAAPAAHIAAVTSRFMRAASDFGGKLGDVHMFSSKIACGMQSPSMGYIRLIEVGSFQTDMSAPATHAVMDDYICRLWTLLGWMYRLSTSVGARSVGRDPSDRPTQVWQQFLWGSSCGNWSGPATAPRREDGGTRRRPYSRIMHEGRRSHASAQ
jgi:hypothetical protein